MDHTRLRSGELLAGAAAAALFVLLFLDWFGTLRVLDRAADVHRTGWGSLGWLMDLGLLAAIGTAAALVVVTAARRPVAVPIGAAVLTTATAIVVTLALAIRLLLLQPGLGPGLPNAAVTLQLPAYLGLLSCALIALGGWIAMADERKDAPSSRAPELTPRPAPPA